MWLWGLQDVQVTTLMYHPFPKEDRSLHCSRFRPWIAGPGSLSGDDCIVQGISCWASSQGKHFLYILSVRGWYNITESCELIPFLFRLKEQIYKSWGLHYQE
jgi:hypothetical protein